MEEALRYTALALTAVFCVLLLKKAEPTFAATVSLLAAVGVGLAAVTAFSVVSETILENSRMPGVLTEAFPLLLQVLGIVWLTSFGAQVCRDCGEGALAMQLEWLGCALAFVRALPLLSGVTALLQTLMGTG